MPKEELKLLIGISRCHKCNLKPHDLCNFIKVNFRENDLFGNTKCVITPAIEFELIPLKSRIRGSATEISLSRNSYILSLRNVTIIPIGIFFLS